MATNPEYYSDETEAVPVANPNNCGAETCKLFNDLMANTYVTVWINIGGKMKRILRFSPLFRERILIDVVGSRSITVDWDCDFIIKLGDNFTHFRQCFREVRQKTDGLTVL